MNRRLVLFNALLVLMLILGGVAVRDQWREFETTHQISAITGGSDVLPKIDQAPTASSEAADWTDIPSHNLFSFDRSDVTIVTSLPDERKPPGPKPFLFGTIFLGPERMAMLGPGQAGNRSYRPMKTGEVIDGWTVSEIQEKAVVIVSYEVRETIVMNDPTGQVARDYARTVPSGAAAPVNPPLPTSIPAAPGSAPKQMRLIETPLGPRMVEVP